MFNPKTQISMNKRNVIIVFVEVKSHHKLEPRGVELFVVFHWADSVWNLTSLSCNSGGLQ